MKSPILAALLAATLLAGCESPGVEGSGKTAVKFGQEKITEMEIERALASVKAQGVNKEKLGETALEALITQRLLAMEARKAGLDKNPEVALDMAAAQRQVLAKAYAENLPGMREEPTAQQITDFYQQNPNLFSNRRIYRLQEIQIEAPQEKFAAIQEQLAKSRNLSEFVEWLKAQGLRGNIADGVKPSEQMTETMRDKLAAMQPGGVVVVPATNGLAVLSVAGVQPQGMTQEQATPAIKKLLMDKRQKEVLEKEVKKLREAVKLEYAEGYGPAVEKAVEKK